MAKIGRQLPAQFSNLSFERFPITTLPAPAAREVRSYVSGVSGHVAAGRGLWLQGSTGTAKTAAACLVVTEARRVGIHAEFWPVPELLVRLGRSRHDDAYDTHEEQLHELLEEVPLLVLDDLSATKNTPWALEQLYVIVNRRYNRSAEGKATIVTTHFDRRDLERRFTRELIRRLWDMAEQRAIDCDAPSG